MTQAQVLDHLPTLLVAIHFSIELKARLTDFMVTPTYTHQRPKTEQYETQTENINKS